MKLPFPGAVFIFYNYSVVIARFAVDKHLIVKLFVLVYGHTLCGRRNGFRHIERSVGDHKAAVVAQVGVYYNIVFGGYGTFADGGKIIAVRRAGDVTFVVLDCKTIVSRLIRESLVLIRVSVIFFIIIGNF